MTYGATQGGAKRRASDSKKQLKLILSKLGTFPFFPVFNAIPGFSIYDSSHVSDWLHVVEGVGHYINIEWKPIVFEDRGLTWDFETGWNKYVIQNTIYNI